jgi:hypothetical protein
MSPEFEKLKVYGTFNMIEESNFFCSKMIDIEDEINIRKSDIIYYQNSNGEQFDISIESSIGSLAYSSINDKRDNHKLKIDEKQTNNQRNDSTKWILEINLKQILTNYIFASLKKSRTFEGIRGNMTRYDDVNVAIRNYIDFNLLDRYKLSQIELFIQYKDLRGQSLLRFKNDWNPNIELTENKLTKLQTETSTDRSSIKVMFNQEKESTKFSFDYFYNLIFVKI